MKPAEYVERLIRKLEIDPSDGMRERTLADMVGAHARQVRSHRLLPFGAMAAGFVLLGLLGVLVLRESAAPVYAVEQTVAAIKKVPVVHILGRDWDDKRIEMWVRVNQETGLMDSCQIRYPDDGRTLVSTPKNTYDYDAGANAVRIKDGPSVTSIFCLGDFFQGMDRLAQTVDAKITYCPVTDPGTKREMLELKLSGPQTEIVCLIDPATKLPISINVTRGGRFGSYDILRNATEIRYNDVPPEGVFDFTVPTGVAVSVETTEDPGQNLPADVLQHCGQFHLKTLHDLAEPNRLHVNTRLFFVDREFCLRSGGFVGVHNDSNEVWNGEIDVFNVDPPQMSLFDAATGKKQQIRLVQHRQSPPGRFRVYWRFEEPLPPGQTRYGIYWRNTRETLSSQAGGEHPLTMSNTLGVAGIENFMLIVPQGMEIRNRTRPCDSDADVGDHRICIWQRRLPPERTVNQVEVALSPGSAATPRSKDKPAPASITRREAVEDIDFLVGQLRAKHPKPFGKTPEGDFNAEIERTKATLPETSPRYDFSLSVAALLAMVKDDHTRHRDFSAYFGHINSGGGVFPAKFRCRDDRMTIDAWSPEVSPARMKAGDVVTSVNGEAMESLVQKYGRYMSLETDLQKRWTLEWAFDRYQVLLGDMRNEYVLQLQDAEGRTYSETLPAVKPWIEKYLDSRPQSPRFHYEFHDNGKACLFKLQTFDWNLRGELETRLNGLIDAMKQNRTEIAILDLRGNGGGNSNMGALVFTKMMDKPCGELRPDPDHSWPVKMALLCDRNTYSAASFEAMLFKDQKMGLIAGEETGGRASFFGDIEQVTLPNSRLVCGIATGYFPRRAGYDDGRGVLPDLPLDVTLDDSILVEKICAHIRGNGGQTNP